MSHIEVCRFVELLETLHSVGVWKALVSIVGIFTTIRFIPILHNPVGVRPDNLYHIGQRSPRGMLAVCACITVAIKHTIVIKICLFISSVNDRLLSVYTHFNANRSLSWLQNYINHSRQQRNLPDICLTFAVMDGVASTQRPTTAHRNERDSYSQFNIPYARYPRPSSASP